MISFKQYLAESPYTPQKISDIAFMDWCEANAPKYLKRLHKYPIVRGFDAPNTGIIDTNGMNRTSANTKNYYTIWMDNHPDWAEYPKRSKSLICSTSTRTASGFGDLSIIIPADSNKIGVCSESDLWGSFTFMNHRVQQHISSVGSLDDLVELIHYIALSAGISETELSQAEKSYSALTEVLKKCTKEKISQAWSVVANDRKKQYIPDTLALFDAYNYKNMFDLMQDVMQPEENDFYVTAAANITVGLDQEVWTQGQCATIRLDYLDGLKPDGAHDLDQPHPLYEFAIKHKLFSVN